MKENRERRPCPKCGKPWFPWPASKLPCHARCYFTADEQDALLVRYVNTPGLTKDRLAAELGVTIGVIQSSLYYAGKRAGRRVA